MPRQREATTGAGSPPALPTKPVPRELRRERKSLLQVREERLRDLGGLALEMYKRDRFNAGLVVERCAELVAIEARVHEIDAVLDGSARLRRKSVTCVCGAPFLLGARFCATCGRPVAEASAGSSDAAGLQ